MRMKNLILIIIVLFIFGLGLMAHPARALDLMGGVHEYCITSGDCTVCDLLKVLFNVAKLVFMSMAGVAMVLLIWAGIGLIMNWGSAESVSKSKKLITNTLLGIVIIMLAWTLVNSLIFFFYGNQGYSWQGRNWWTGPECEHYKSPSYGIMDESEPCGGLTIAGINSKQCHEASPALNKLLTCLHDHQSEYNLPAPIEITSITTDKASFEECRTDWTEKRCIHKENSCHFGGPDKLNDGSYAADIRSWAYHQDLLDYSTPYDNTRLESIKSLVAYCGGQFYEEEDHFHISHPDCGAL